MRKRHERAAVSERVAPSPSPLACVEERTRIRELLADLPARELEVIQLKIYGQLSYRQIATVTGLVHVVEYLDALRGKS